MKDLDFTKPYLPSVQVVTAKDSVMNPFMELVIYAHKTFFDENNPKFNLTMKEAYNILSTTPYELIDRLNAEFAVEGFTYAIAETANKKIVIDITKDGQTAAHIYLWPASDEKEGYNAELNFEPSKLFEFAEIGGVQDNFEFFGPGDNLSFDMLIACAQAVQNRTEFLKECKVRNILMKNIESFVTKFIRPWTEDCRVLYNAATFQIGAIAGDKLYVRKNYTYGEYIKWCKEYGAAIREVTGEKYYHEL